MRLLIFIWEWILEISDFLVRLYSVRCAVPVKPRILIVRIDALGDFVLWLGSGKVLADHYRALGYEIHLLANRVCEGLADALPFWDHTLFVDRLRFHRDIVYRVSTQLRVKRRYQIVIQPTYSREYFFGDSIVRISGAPERIGAVGDHSNCSASQKEKADRFYMRLIPSNPAPCHELQRAVDFVKQVTGQTPALPLIDLRCFLDGIKKSDHFIVSPGAGWKRRCWPVRNFAAVARRIHEKFKLKCLVSGTKAEERLCREFVAAAAFPVEMVNGESCIDYVKAIAGSKFVLCNESASVHVAAACRVPVLSVSGGGHFGRFLPYPQDRVSDKVHGKAFFKKMECFGCNWKCIYSGGRAEPVPCIECISVEDVWLAAEKILAAV